MTSRVPPRYRELSPEELANDPPQNFKLVSIEGELIPVQYMGTMANVQRMFGIGVADEYTLESLAARFNTTEEEMNRRLLEAKPVPVPDGMYLMMGDNRNGSFDSRGWGLVKRSDIVGRSDAIWLPVGRWRLTH
jgi:signal peptidase I